MRARAALAVALTLAGCGRAERARERISRATEHPALLAFDWARPEGSLRMGPDEAASRIGSFDWDSSVSWSASNARTSARVQAAERHRLRQLAGGDFAVESDIDPGQGPGSETGRRVVWVKGMTYARSRFPASGAWRERPTDRGRDARRFRDESFLAADVVDLLGGALKLVPKGEATALGRPAKRYALVLDRQAFAPGPSRLGESPPAAGVDEDTKRRLAFLDGREPLAADGLLLADAATGVPLEIRLRASFKVRDDPDARVDLDLAGRLTAVGGAVGTVEPPSNALPDERKPKGVARALEAAGLRKKKAPSGEAEPEPDSDSE
ncbi:MAG TPA: hypothetical protein VMT17_19790 [Anaeromyxobacteraceae bacterium]|nr:hypothetical protein [Anaeromyxobacteraceae bacterium]